MVAYSHTAHGQSSRSRAMRSAVAMTAAAAAGLQQQVVRGVAAAVVRGLLLLAGDVEPNPGPPKGAGKEKKGGRKDDRHEENEAENMDASRQSQSGGAGNKGDSDTESEGEVQLPGAGAERQNLLAELSSRNVTVAGVSHLSTVADKGRRMVEIVAGVKPEPPVKVEPMPDSPLHVAAAANDLGMLRALLSDPGADQYARTADGSTILHKAAAAGASEVVEFLIEQHGEDMWNLLDAEGRTPLALAIYYHRMELARRLNNLDRTTRHYKLHYLAQHGHLQAVQEALAANAPPDLSDEHDVTPLHRACKFGHTAVVKELLHTRKVDIDAVTDKGWTPVLYAAAAGSADIIRMLLEHARDKRLENTFMTQRLPKNNSLDAGLDVLLLAAKYGHCEVATVALDSGANMVTADPRGNNPLHLAIIGGTPSHLATMQLLLQRGAKWDEQNEKSYTPALLAACHTEYCRAPSSCSHKKMHAEFISRFGKRAECLEILLAARQGDVAKVQQFLLCACDTCRKLPPGGLTCGNGWTALLVASKHGRTAVVEALLGAKVDIEVTVTATCSTALIQASAYFHPDVVKLLLGAGAKVYRADSQGNTALHRVCNKPLPKDEATLARQVSVLKQLLSAAAAYRSMPAEIDDPAATAAANGNTLTTLTSTSVAPAAAAGAGGGSGALATMGGAKAVAAAASRKIKVYEVDMLNAQNAEGATPLMMAAMMGNMALVEVLLKNTRIDVTIPDKNGALAVHKASRSGNLRMVKELIAAGSPVLPTDGQGNSPLHEAAAGGHVEVLRYLLTAQDGNEEQIHKIVDTTNDQGWTSLHYACEHGHVDMLKVLLEYQADPKRTIASGAGALALACRSCCFGVIEVLADTFKGCQDLFKANTGGWNPVSMVAQQKDLAKGCELLRVLILAIEEVAAAGVAAAQAAEAAGKTIEAAEELAWKPEDVSRVINQAVAANGYTALHWAAERGNKEAVEFLLCADPRRADVQAFTKRPALHCAAHNGHNDICKMLLEANADIDAVDEDGRQALAMAVYSNMQETAEELLLAVAKRHESTEPALIWLDRVRGFAPIHYAAMRGNIECVQLLERYGQDLEQLTRSGRTPLEIAAAYGQDELVDYLLSKHCTMETLPKPLKHSKSKWRSDGPVNINKKEAVVTIMDGACATLACSLPASRGLSYFEIAIGRQEDDPQGKRPTGQYKVAVGIGVDRSTCPPHPGKAPGTFGYYGRSGMLFMGTGMDNSKRYGPKFGPNDTIGVILNRSTRTISFTRNGTHLGVAVSEKEMGPDLQLDSMNLLVMVEGIGELYYNLGQASSREPFLCSMDDVACDEEELHCKGLSEPWRFKDRLHPIHLAAYAKSIPVLKRLLEAGAACAQEDGDGWTPLHFAALAGWHEGIELLMQQHKAQVKREMRAGQGVVDKLDTTTTEEGVAHAAYVNNKTKSNSSPLRFAVKNSHLRASEMLIKKGGADCLVTDSQHRTLLMLAASTGQIQLMELLIRKGVAVQSKDAAGRTALQYASNAAAAEYLEKQTNETIPYDGFDWIELRVDSSTKQGAVGCVVMGKLCKTGEKIALKYHSKQENRDDTYKMLTSCFANGREARQYICCVPADLPEHQAKFDDPEKFPGHPYCLVLEGGDQTLQEILDELGPVEVPPGQAVLQLPDGQVKFMFGCLVTALELVHNKGYAHHDLKAANFVRFYDGKFKLIDFDNARQAGRDPAGHTTPEICSPEYAKYYMATKLASRAKGGAPLKPPLSSQAMDMWSLGCVLYQLCTRRRLVADLAGWSAEEFQMRSADDAMKVWAEYKEVQLDPILEEQLLDSDAHQQAKELLQQLLKAKPEARLSIHQVSNSVFFGKGVATLKAISNNLSVMNTKMDNLVTMVTDIKERTVALADLPAQLQAGFTKVSGEIGSFRKMFMQTHKAVCPGTFVLGPELPVATILDPAATTKELTSWTQGLSSLFSGQMSLSDIADQMTHQTFCLKLVCESCGEPQGEGYSVKKPREWVPAMLPAMQVSLTVAKIANVGLGIASIMFPQVPQIPDSVLEAGDAILSALDHKSSAEDFACIQGTLDGESADGKTFQQQVDDGLRQLASFLATVDPTQTWGGLALVDLGAIQTDQEAAGQPVAGGDNVVEQDVLWVCKGCLAGKCSTGSGGGKGAGPGDTAKQCDQLTVKVKEQEGELTMLKTYISSNGLPLPSGDAAGAGSGRWGGAAAAPGQLAGPGSPLARSSSSKKAGTGSSSGSGNWLGCLPGGNKAAAVHPAP